MSANSKTKISAKTKAPDAGQVLDRLVRMINRADDFVLGFVKCNHLSQQKEMRRDLLARLSDRRVLEVELDRPLVSLLDELTERWDAENPPDVVCVYGLEKSINELQEASPVLGRLNNDRDLLRRAVSVPLLIWLPDFALDFIARGAPDFWAWRSGVYEFETDKALWQQEGVLAIIPDKHGMFSLDHHEKSAEIAHLKELLRTAQRLRRKGKREKGLIVSLLDQLGLVYLSMGRLAEASTIYRQSLEAYVALDNKSGIASALHQLALLQQMWGNLTEADDLYRKSWEINEALGNSGGVASTLHQLANLQYLQGNLEEAERLYRESLSIENNLSGRTGVAITLHQLANLQYVQGNLEEAEQLYWKSLEIKKEQGDKSGITSTLHQLAMLEQSRGNPEKAERLYWESLEIKQKLGDKSGIAITHGQLGQLYQQQEKWCSALQHSVKAWVLFCELQSPYSNLALSDVQTSREHVGVEQFNTWLAEDFGPQAAEIQKRLDEALDAQPNTVRQEPAAVG